MEEIMWKNSEEVPAELAKYVRELIKKGYLTSETGATTFEVVSPAKGNLDAGETEEAKTEAPKEHEQEGVYANLDYIDDETWQDGENDLGSNQFKPETLIGGSDTMSREENLHTDDYYNFYQSAPDFGSYEKEMSAYLADIMVEREQQTDMSYALMSPRQTQLVASSFLNADQKRTGYIRKDQLVKCLNEADIYPDEPTVEQIKKNLTGDVVDWNQYFFLCQSITARPSQTT